MELELPGCRIRSWRPGDEHALARHADNRNIWLNVRDRFPHPYTLAAAEWWVTNMPAAEPETQFAVEVDGEAAGGVGLFLQEDVARYSAEIGYWLGEAHWGKGLMTAVVHRLGLHQLRSQSHLRQCVRLERVVRSGAGEGRLRVRGAAAERDGEGRPGARQPDVRRRAPVPPGWRPPTLPLTPVQSCTVPTSPVLPGHGHCPIVRPNPQSVRVYEPSALRRGVGVCGALWVGSGDPPIGRAAGRGR
jgi:hypothetical protein